MDKKAFFDILNQDGPDSYDYLRKLLNEIFENLCQFVPTRKDIHQQLRNDLFTPDGITWDTQVKLVNWIEKFQAPIHDKKTSVWKKSLPQEDIEQFLKDYYEHLEIVYKEVQEAKRKIRAGENIFNPVTGKLPTNMKTGR